VAIPLDDLVANHLRYPGELYVKLNKEIKRLAYNRDVLAMANRNGAKVGRWRGVIRMNVAAPRVIRL
jgi:hypothetical protein